MLFAKYFIRRTGRRCGRYFTLFIMLHGICKPLFLCTFSEVGRLKTVWIRTTVRNCTLCNFESGNPLCLFNKVIIWILKHKTCECLIQIASYFTAPRKNRVFKIRHRHNLFKATSLRRWHMWRHDYRTHLQYDRTYGDLHFFKIRMYKWVTHISVFNHRWRAYFKSISHPTCQVSSIVVTF